MSTNPNTEDSASGLTTETGEASNFSAKDTSSRNNGRSPAPPHLAGSSARDRLTSGASGSSDRTGTSGTTDSEELGATTTDADGEIEGIFEKEYEEGDCGKVEALHDLQEVFNELEGENLIQGFDVYTSYNMQPPKPPKARANSSTKKSRVNSARRSEELTPGPRVGHVLKNKKPMDLTKAFNSMNQTSIHSLPELEKKGPGTEALMRYEPTASLPLLGNKVDPLKRNPQGKKSKFVNPSELPPTQKQRIPLRSSRASPQISSASSSSRPPTHLVTAEELALAEAHQKVREDLDFLPETSEGDEEGVPDEAGVLYRRLSSAESSFSERSTSSRGLTGIRTPTLPQKRETPGPIRKKPVESWKSDLAKVTRVKSIHKPPLHMPGPEGSTLQLKYKPPIWPHQKSLIQILDRMPLLTCLVLDGSEINFLRDLGSHLPSLQTLSVAKCGLRSLDGTFAFPNLRTLIASGNNITLPVQASYLQQLCHLDLSFNPLKAMETFQQLVMCPTLVSLSLVGCPVSQHPDFYTKMKKLLPQVKELRPEFYSPASWNYNTAQSEAQGKKEAEAEELDPSQMMRLHDYIDREIQKSTSHRESLILKTEPLFTTTQFVAKFQKNFEKFRLNLERSRESMELGFSESDSYISDVTTTEYTTTNEEAIGRKSSLPFTGILGSSEVTTTTTTTADIMTPPRVTTFSETTTATAPKTEDTNRSQGASLLGKGYSNDDDGGDVGGAGYSSEVEDFWDAQETQEDLLLHEDISDGNEEEEFEEATTDAGDFGVVSDEQDMYLRRYEHTDDIEEGDGDHV